MEKVFVYLPTTMCQSQAGVMYMEVFITKKMRARTPLMPLLSAE